MEWNPMKFCNIGGCYDDEIVLSEKRRLIVNFTRNEISSDILVSLFLKLTGAATRRLVSNNLEASSL